MASSSAEFASCLQIPKTQNNVDLSWLPNYNDTNNSDHSNNHITQNDSDDSWLPNYNDTNTKTSSKSSHSNVPKPLPKTNKDFDDDSWLPPTPVRNNKIKENHVYDPRISNHKKNIVTKTDLSKSYRKPEIADYSWLPSTPIVNNKDQKKQTNSSSSNNNNKSSSSNNNQKNSSNYDNWERAREAAIFSGHQQAQHTKVLSKQASTSSECSVETDSLGGVSTLLRRWKDVETKKPNQKLIPASCIKNNDHKTDESLVDSIPVSKKESFVGENKCFPRVVGKPRLIRGRQAYLDFLTMMEQDKRQELESLTRRKVVSNFPNRGRIQALLRVRFIRIRAENLKEAKSNKHSVSKTMKSIWDKFSTGVKQDTPASRKPKNNNEEVMKKPNTCPECSADCSPVKEVPVTTTATTTASSQEPVSTTASQQSAQEDTHSEILLPNTADHQQKSQCPSPKMYSSGPENCHEWINEYSQTESDWNDEEEEDYCSYNWVSDIARPRSDWECMRQERYEEMLHLQPCNQDISQLLERKTVSGFLSSDQRSMLDQLMVTRAQSISRTETKKEEKHEESEFIGQTAGSSPPTRSPALKERSRNHHRRRRSSQHHPSLDMEFIYDLRKHMEQIHQELMELRKAVTSCVNMQIKNQQQPIQKKRSEQTSPTRSCCVCYTMQADSFLYRCGHMCACYHCGLELQCTSGKCPICEDPILDVVRACAYGD